MDILEVKTGNILVLVFKGRLDANTSNGAQEKIMGLIDRGEIRLVADLSELDYISSAGLRVFMVAAKKLKSCNGKIALCSLKEHIKEIFDIAGFSVLFPTHDLRDEAIKSLQ